MSEDLENIITKGFHSWTRNLNICIPLVINYLLQFAVMFFATIAVMLLFFGRNLSGIDSMTEDEIFDLMSFSFMENLTGIIIITFLVFLILFLFNAYFFAGAVGMSQNATARGDTSIKDMFNAGNSNFINIFLASFLIMLMNIAGIIFMVPGAILTRNYMEVIESTPFTSGILLLIIGIVMWVIYLLILNVVLAIALYSIVIEKIGAMDGIIRGYSFFIDNKFSVFVLVAGQLHNFHCGSSFFHYCGRGNCPYWQCRAKHDLVTGQSGIDTGNHPAVNDDLVDQAVYGQDRKGHTY